MLFKDSNEAVRGDLGIDTLQSRRDKAKLKWWYKLVTMPNIKSHRGRQRKVWSRIINDLFVSLELDKAEWLKDIMEGSSYKLVAMPNIKSHRGRQRKVFCVIGIR